jgi:dTDP-4-amino-4,6-dideoxygalactose transaminase
MSSELAIAGGKPVRTQRFAEWPIFGEAEEKALVETLRSGRWGKLDGEQVPTFERRFAQYVQAKHGIAVTNGTVSLRIALMAAGVEAGDEVIVPPYTFLATATAVVEANAVPIFVDIERDTFNIDPQQIEAAVTPRTRAIIVVHLGGMPCDMDGIMAIAERHKLVVIEDAAHAHGSEYKSRRCGSIGHMASFSFQSSKNLCSGEGGIITTNDDRLADRCRSVHNCGRVAGGAWYEHHVMSGNYRLGEFQGAILNCQLDRLDEQTAIREGNAHFLDQHLGAIAGITPQRREAFVTRGAYHLYLLRYDEQVYGVPRQRMLEALEAEGIPVAPGYVLPLYRQPLFAQLRFGPYTGYRESRPHLDYNALHLANVERICGGEGAWIYQSVLLGSRQDMQSIVDAFAKINEHREELISPKKAEAAG